MRSKIGKIVPPIADYLIHNAGYYSIINLFDMTKCYSWSNQTKNVEIFIEKQESYVFCFASTENVQGFCNSALEARPPEDKCYKQNDEKITALFQTDGRAIYHPPCHF